MEKQRTAYLLPPQYDIDADYTDTRVAYKIIDTLWGFLDILPDSAMTTRYDECVTGATLEAVRWNRPYA